MEIVFMFGGMAIIVCSVLFFIALCTDSRDIAIGLFASIIAVSVCIVVAGYALVKTYQPHKQYSVVEYVHYGYTNFGKITVKRCTYNKWLLQDPCEAEFGWAGHVKKIKEALETLEPKGVTNGTDAK